MSIFLYKSFLTRCFCGVLFLLAFIVMFGSRVSFGVTTCPSVVNTFISECDLDGNDQVVINSGGGISSATTDGISVLSTSNGASIVNSGVISVTKGTDNDGVRSSNADNISVYNRVGGIIFGGGSAIHISDSDGVYIENDGVISGFSGVYGSGIELGSGVTNATIINGALGLITSYREDGIEIFQSSSVYILNYGTILGDVNNEWDEEGVEIGQSSDVVLDNRGTIYATGTAVYNTASSNTTIINSGEIYTDIDNRAISTNNNDTRLINHSSGSIYSYATATANSVIFYSNGLDTSIENLGSVTLYNNDTIAAAENKVLDLDSIDSDGWVNNGGSIRVINSSTSDYNAAYGLSVDNDVDGRIENSGTISVLHSGLGNAAVAEYGIFVGGNLNGDVTNSGTIETIDDVFSPGGYENVIRVGGGSGLIQNYENGVIAGTLDIDGDVALINAGTLMTPLNTGSSISDIEGDYTQTSTGAFYMGANNLLEYGQLNVGGAAAISDGAKILLDVAPTFGSVSSGDKLDDVIASTDLTKYGDIDVLDNNLSLGFVAVDDGNENVDLILFETGLEDTICSNVSCDSVGYALEDISEDEIEFAIGSVTSTGELEKVVAELTPTGLRHVAEATKLQLKSAVDLVYTRQGITSGGLSSGDDVDAERHYWFRAFGYKSDQDERDDIDGFKLDGRGVWLGFDTNVNSESRLGIAFGYSSGDLDAKGLADQRVDFDTMDVVIYGSRELTDDITLYLQGLLGSTDYESKRTVLGSQAHASFDGWHGNVEATLVRQLDFRSDFLLKPFARFGYSYVSLDDYDETGAGVKNWHMDSFNRDSLTLSVGSDAEKKVADGVYLTGNAAVGYDFLTSDDSFDGTMGGVTAEIETVDQSPVFLKGGLGLKALAGDNFVFSLNYDVTGRQDFHSQSLFLNGMYKF